MTRQEHGSLRHKDGRGCTVAPRKQYFDIFRGVKQSSPAASCTFLSCLALYVSSAWIALHHLWQARGAYDSRVTSIVLLGSFKS